MCLCVHTPSATDLSPGLADTTVRLTLTESQPDHKASHLMSLCCHSPWQVGEAEPASKGCFECVQSSWFQTREGCLGLPNPLHCPTSPKKRLLDVLWWGRGGTHGLSWSVVRFKLSPFCRRKSERVTNVENATYPPSSSLPHYFFSRSGLPGVLFQHTRDRDCGQWHWSLCPCRGSLFPEILSKAFHWS